MNVLGTSVAMISFSFGVLQGKVFQIDVQNLLKNHSREQSI